MSCRCHGKQGTPVKGTVHPEDQCLVCATKHLEMAVVAWGEFTYEESNRRWVAGHVRLAVEHTKADHREFALALRDVAVAIENHEDRDMVEVRDRLTDLYDLCLKMLSEEKPAMHARIDRMATGRRTDVFVPLGSGSTHNDCELKMLLRSLEENAFDLGTVYLATKHVPDWLDTSKVVIVDLDDPYTSNKDANLHYKTLETIRMHSLHDFVWSADDAALLQPTALADLPVIRNHRPVKEFEQPSTKWRNRVWNTIQWAKSLGVELEWQYECHCPQLFDGQALLAGMEQVDYRNGQGLTIYTAWRVVTDTWKNAVPQPDFKWTFEFPLDEGIRKMDDDTLCSKMFLGYNEPCSGIVLGRLEKLFTKRSKFER